MSAATRATARTVALCTAGELYGGIESFVLALARRLHTSGDAKVLCVLFQDGELADELRKNDLPVQIVRERHKYDLGVIGQLRAVFAKGNVEIVHTNGYKANLLCGIAGRWAGAKVVKTEHGAVETDRGRARLKMQLNVKIAELVSMVTHNAVVFVSNDLACQGRGRPEGTVQAVIYNGVEVNGDGAAGRTESSLAGTRRFRVGVIGRLVKVKGHLYLLRALRQLRDLDDLEVHVFGTGPLEDELRQYCAAHGLSERVVFRGFVRPMEPHLSDLDAMAIPSLQEGIPYAMLEGMAQSLAIVASAVGGIPEILRDGDTALLVPPREQDALAGAIRSLYVDPGLLSRLGKASQVKVATDLSVAVMAGRYLDLYDRLASP